MQKKETKVKKTYKKPIVVKKAYNPACATPCGQTDCICGVQVIYY